MHAHHQGNTFPTVGKVAGSIQSWFLEPLSLTCRPFSPCVYLRLNNVSQFPTSRPIVGSLQKSHCASRLRSWFAPWWRKCTGMLHMESNPVPFQSGDSVQPKARADDYLEPQVTLQVDRLLLLIRQEIRVPITTRFSLLLTTRPSPLIAKVSGIYLPDSILVVWVVQAHSSCSIVVRSGWHLALGGMGKIWSLQACTIKTF